MPVRKTKVGTDIPKDTISLTGKVTGWFKKPRNRIREVPLDDVTIEADDLNGLPVSLNKMAWEVFVREKKGDRNLDAIRVVVEFQTDLGIKGKMSYIAEA